MSEQPNISVSIKRRYHLIDRALNNLLPNMYPCDYKSSDHFVEGVLDEIFYYIRNESDFNGIDLMTVNDFILEHKYDELTDYFNQHCIVLKNDYLQEHIRRILREEDFIPLESLNLVIKDYEDGFDVYIMGEDKKIGEISFTKEDKPNQYTIVDATIDDEYKGNRIYPKTIIKLFKEKPNIIINSVFRSPEAEKAWKYLLSDLPSDIEKKIKHYKEENTTLYQLKLKNLQESIRRILREEDYSPAGKEITPNSIVVHKSNPMFRKKIMDQGLKVKSGECYKIFVGYGVKCKPAIFATNSTNKRAWFDSTYDDDIWFIDTRMIPDVKWYKDKHFESTKKHIVTFQDIPKEAITLKYEGTGSGDVKTWDKKSPNLSESIKRILREDSNYFRMMMRRLPSEIIEKMDEKFNSALNENSRLYIKYFKSNQNELPLKQFTGMVIMDFMNNLQVTNYLPNDVEWYDDLRSSLTKLYQDRITSAYNLIKK